MKRIFLPGARLPLLPGGSGLKDVQSPLIPQAWGRERRVGAIPQVQEWIQIITAVPGRKRETSASWSPVGLAKQNFNRISTDCDFIEKVSKISLRNSCAIYINNIRKVVLSDIFVVIHPTETNSKTYALAYLEKIIKLSLIFK